MPEPIDYTIENVGGVVRADLHLEPGVNLLRGRNACGKTTSFDAISRAQGAKVELEKRDGADKGRVEGGGVKLTVGKVVRRSGSAALALADVSPLSTLIDPQLKDTDAAARARIKALIELLGVAVDDLAVSVLTGGAEGHLELADWLRGVVQEDAIDDLVVAAEKLRGQAHARARGHETTAEEASGRADAALERGQTALEALRGEAITGQTVAEAKAALVEGSRAYERASAQCEARETLEAQQKEIRAAIGERPDAGAVTEEIKQLSANLATISEETARLRGLLEDQRASLERAEADLGNASGNRASLERAAEAWDRQQAILSQALVGPTREELAKARAEHVDAPSAAVETAQRSWDYAQAQADRRAAQETRESADREAYALRSLADQIPQRLGEILAAAGAEGLSVVNGRLHAVRGGQVLDWERRLSDGERTIAALNIAASVCQGVWPLAGEFWTTLDPERQAEFAALAEKLGLYVLSEEPADGELRVEHVGGAAREGRG